MLALRLVLDTNVLVSAALKPDGLQRTVLLLALAKPARLYVSAPILAEYKTVLSRAELQIRKGLRHRFLQLIKTRAHLARPVRRLAIAADPDDNIFLISFRVLFQPPAPSRPMRLVRLFMDLEIRQAFRLRHAVKLL